MNELRIFNNPELGEVRMVMIDDKPYFVGNDVARILEYSRPNDAISANCKGAVIYRIHTPGGMQNAKVIPEGDMYRLIVKAAVQSNSEKVRKAAEKFDFVLGNWYQLHVNTERHHLLSRCPEDVNLLDVVEIIVDCVCAGKTRSGEVRDLEISADILEKALKNTVKLVDDMTVVK